MKQINITTKSIMFDIVAALRLMRLNNIDYQIIKYEFYCIRIKRNKKMFTFSLWTIKENDIPGYELFKKQLLLIYKNDKKKLLNSLSIELLLQIKNLMLNGGF